MRRIARVLRSGTMSLYWHMANKQQLLDLMQDRPAGEAMPPEPAGDWRAGLHAFALAGRAMLHQHRWVMDFIGGRPSLGPNTMLNLERALATLDGLGLGLDRYAINALKTVMTYLLGRGAAGDARGSTRLPGHQGCAVRVRAELRSGWN